jgi:hypothetical protein
MKKLCLLQSPYGMQVHGCYHSAPLLELHRVLLFRFNVGLVPACLHRFCSDGLRLVQWMGALEKEQLNLVGCRTKCRLIQSHFHFHKWSVALILIKAKGCVPEFHRRQLWISAYMILLQQSLRCRGAFHGCVYTGS